MALYTGKGDAGTTKVLDSKNRFSKGSDMAEALGSLDELNSWVGLCKAKSRGVHESAVVVGKQGTSIPDILHEIQENLFIVQAQVAGSKGKKISQAKVTRIEKLINTIEEEIPPIKQFAIAGATELSALLDVSRTMARRTERRVIIVHDAGDRKLTKHTLAYLNRLSSLLFALARLMAHRSGIRERNPQYK